ncbi:Ubiquitin-like protein 3 [Dissostichus eleginoides]|uniref:Ubiquitin-like protein 3 n=1 Tax=Dissostichus eleginoides TaxID=100907 RepID=A0AAD9BGJ4_DISEL|nr:Ubiquitin-like protein 3 [Dissostichus eleginoides]
MRKNVGGSLRDRREINLRLILVSGKTKEFLFSPNDSAADIAKHVYDNWPMDWEEEQVSSPNILRLIYQGRFLHGNVTLGVFHYMNQLLMLAK